MLCVVAPDRKLQRGGAERSSFGDTSASPTVAEHLNGIGT